MIVYDFPQRSDEWLRTKKGVFSASSIGKWILKPKWTATDMRSIKDAIYTKLAEVSGGPMLLQFQSKEMERGIRMEPYARAEYESIVGCDVEEVGFCKMDNLPVGCSPDGFLCDRTMLIEIKCPTAKKHIQYVIEGKLPDQYQPQVEMQMAVTGADSCDFFSYCPPIKPFLVNVQRSDMTETVEKNLKTLSDMYEDYRQTMAEHWKKTLDNEMRSTS